MAEDKYFEAANKLFDSFKPFHEERKFWNDLTERRIRADLGKLYHDVGLRFRSYRPQHDSRRFTAMLDTASITFGARARSLREKAKEDAQAWESWLNVAFPLLNQGSLPPLSLSRSQRAIMGAGIWCWDIHPEWAMLGLPEEGDPKKRVQMDEEAKLEIGLPILWSSPDLLTCAWLMDEGGLAVMVERSKRRVNPIARAFGMGYKNSSFYELAPGQPVETSDDMLESVEFTRVSDCDEIRYYVKGTGDLQLLKRTPNPWKQPPYNVVPALICGGSRDENSMFRPLIEGSLAMAEYDNFAESIVLLAGYLTGTPTYDMFLDPNTNQAFLRDPDSGEPLEIELVPGQPMVKVLPGKMVQRTIQMGVDMNLFRDRIRLDADRYGFPSGLSGQTPEPRTPAWALAAAGEQAMFQIDPAIKAEQNALIEAATMIGRVIKNYIKEEIPILTVVKGEEGEKDQIVKISGDQIHEVDLTVGVNIPSTSIQLAKMQQYGQDVDKGRFPLELYLEEIAGVKDVQKAMRMIRLEGLKVQADGLLLQDVLTHVNRRRLEEGEEPLTFPEAPGTVQTTNRPSATQVRPPAAGGAPIPEAPVGVGV